MSERTFKVASLVQQIVAEELRILVPVAELGVNSVDVSPDLRNARVWIGIIAVPERQKEVMGLVESVKAEVQAAVAKKMSTKFVPRIAFELDTGGEHADRINRLLGS